MSYDPYDRRAADDFAAEVAAAEAEQHYHEEREHHLDMAARFLHGEEPLPAILDRLIALEVEARQPRNPDAGQPVTEAEPF